MNPLLFDPCPGSILQAQRSAAKKVIPEYRGPTVSDFTGARCNFHKQFVDPLSLPLSLLLAPSFALPSLLLGTLFLGV